MTTVKYVYASSDRQSLGFTQLLFEIRTVHTTSNRKGYRYFRRPRGCGYEFQVAQSTRWYEQAEPDPEVPWRETLTAARQDAEKVFLARIDQQLEEARERVRARQAMVT